ncbi:MAG: hypothetical protein C3F11_06370 [Methylocystaceae bacterium]|nr:MAG: hypothetical protein C3F11_06370 [Methylocystaceae bacterium]
MTITAIDSRIIISPTEFFELSSVNRIRDPLEIGLTNRSYLPKSNDLRSDWVASVATPAFKALAQTGVFAPRFCTIGTGVGLDAHWICKIYPSWACMLIPQLMAAKQYADRAARP